MYLMLVDKPVLYFDLDDFVVHILSPELVPFSMRYAFKNDNTPKALMYNISLIKNYMSSRVLSLGRENAKQIYTMFCIPQLNDLETRVKICEKCKGVSVQDSYWIKEDNSPLTFKDVNIRLKHFKEIIEISLLGYNPTITTNQICPELTTHGLFRKSWVRQDNKLYLLKSDSHSQNINTKMEVLASKILKCFDNKISCIEYTGRYRNTKDGRLYVDKCENFVEERYSFVEAWEVMNYCQCTGQSFESVLGFSKEAASIGVLDFILSNTDRHSQNYGFLMDNITGKLICLAPLFDFNCALVADVFNRDASDTLSQMFNDGRTLRQIADYYLPYSRLTLDYDKFNKLKKNNKEFDYVFDRVLERCKYLMIV